jgi:hypothetical protein
MAILPKVQQPEVNILAGYQSGNLMIEIAGDARSTARFGPLSNGFPDPRCPLTSGGTVRKRMVSYGSGKDIRDKRAALGARLSNGRLRR